MIMPYLHQFVLLSNVLMCMMLQNSLETQILMLLVSMGDSNRLPSDDPFVRLPHIS